ncbi:MAG: FtsX-like permease family protein [Candidatus Hodarchaeales archaeon]
MDVTSRSIIDDYFEEGRTTDVIVNCGGLDPIDLSQHIKELSTTNRSDFGWIDRISYGYRWHCTLFTHSAPEEITVNEIGTGSITLILSVNGGFYADFDNMIEMVAGEFDVGPGRGVVSENIASLYDIEIGDSMNMFTWLQSTAFVQDNDLRAINDTATINVTGIVADSSKIFSSQFSRLSPGFFWVSRMGAIITGFTALPDPDYFQILRVQPGPNGLTDSFDNIVFIKAKSQIVDYLNPDSSINKLKELESEIRGRLDIVGNFQYFSPLQDALEEYRFWLTSARVFLSILSMPVILTGWYLLNFSFSHTFEERKREIAGLKSRGFSNNQLWFMVIFEALLLGIIGAIAGLILGIAINAVLETSTSFLVFDFSLLSLDSISSITPITLLTAAVAAIVIMIIVSIIPVTSIINLPVDEITQEEQIGATEKFSVNQIKIPAVMMITGFIISIGLFANSSEVAGDSFLTILALVGLLAFITGSLSFMANIARFLPMFIEKLHIGLNSPHLFLVSRELSRRSKKTTAAFIVLALTLAFGIFSSLTIQSSNYYLLQDAYFEVGSDVSIEFTGASGFGNVPESNWFRLSNKTIYPEIKNIVRFLHYQGIMLDPGEPYPLSPSSIRNTIINTGGVLNIIFINASEYMEGAYHRDFFIESDGDTDPLVALNSNPNSTALIDRQTAIENNITLGDIIRFSTGRDRVYEGEGEVVGIVDFFSPGFQSGYDSFIITDRRSLNTEFRSAEYTSSWFLIDLEDKSSGLEVSDRIQKDRFIFGVDRVNSVEEITIQLSDEFSTLMQTLNLDFYYSLIVSAVGFLIVLEIRVQERKKEIGAIKALGMSNNQTVLMILLEGGISIFVASFTGVLTGIISGALMVPLLFNQSLPPELSIPVDIFIMQLFLAIVFALIGTLFPALLTNRWVPADLVKQEG